MQPLQHKQAQTVNSIKLKIIWFSQKTKSNCW